MLRRQLEAGSPKSDSPDGSSLDRAKRHADSIVPVAAAPVRPGFVAIQNSGKVPLAAGEELDTGSSEGDGSAAAGSDSIRDSRSHAARNMSFETESARSPAMAADPEIDLAQRGDGRSGSAAGARRVETVPHVVESNENFWTISGQYYGSGRYYRALWKANADRCPQIDGLRVSDVIIIPPAEDLDPAYIDPPGKSARPVKGGKGSKSGTAAGNRRGRRDGVADATGSDVDSRSESAALAPSSDARLPAPAPARAPTSFRIQTTAFPSSAPAAPAMSLSCLPLALSRSLRRRRPVERSGDRAFGEGLDDEPRTRTGAGQNRPTSTRAAFRTRGRDIGSGPMTRSGPLPAQR